MHRPIPPLAVEETLGVFSSEFHGENYNSFPSATRNARGELLVAFRQARDMRYHFGETRHVDPVSRAMFVKSRDDGSTFEEPALLHDHFIYGVQDPCLTTLRDGSLLATVFYWDCRPAEADRQPAPGELFYYNHTISARPLGLCSFLSHDGATTWTEPVRVSPQPIALRGSAIETPGGDLLLAAYTLNADSEVVIFRSGDRGGSWQETARIAVAVPLNETSLFQTRNGKLVALMRSEMPAPDGALGYPLHTAESFDGGATWSEPVRRPLYSPSPFHALQLHSGKVLVTYGKRNPPFGIDALLVDAELEHWNPADVVSLRDGPDDDDIGYTSSVQCADGSILVFYYYHDAGSRGFRHIAATRCRETQAGGQGSPPTASDHSS